MTSRICNTPPGLDYAPVTGVHTNISFGVVQSGQSDPPLRLADVIAKRLFPRKPMAGVVDWGIVTAENWDILLPTGAPNELWKIAGLCEEYHANDGGFIQDLAAVITIRWPQAEALTNTLPLHEAWEHSRQFARLLVDQLSVAAVVALHVPARSWARGAPHAHLMLPCRVVRPGSGFATFCRPIANPVEGRELVDAAWSEYSDRQILV